MSTASSPPSSSASLSLLAARAFARRHRPYSAPTRPDSTETSATLPSAHARLDASGKPVLALGSPLAFQSVTSPTSTSNSSSTGVRHSAADGAVPPGATPMALQHPCAAATLYERLLLAESDSVIDLEGPRERTRERSTRSTSRRDGTVASGPLPATPERDRSRQHRDRDRDRSHSSQAPFYSVPSTLPSHRLVSGSTWVRDAWYAARVQRAATAAATSVPSADEFLSALLRCTDAPLLATGEWAPEASRNDTAGTALPTETLAAYGEELAALYLSTGLRGRRDDSADPARVAERGVETAARVRVDAVARQGDRPMAALVALELERLLSDVRFERHSLYTPASFPHGGYREWKHAEAARLEALRAKVWSSSSPPESRDGDYHGLHAHHDHYRLLLRLCLAADHSRTPLPALEDFLPASARVLREYALQFGVDPLHANLMELEALEAVLAPSGPLLRRIVSVLRRLQARPAATASHITVRDINSTPAVIPGAGSGSTAETAAGHDNGAAGLKSTGGTLPSPPFLPTRTRLNMAEAVRLQTALAGLRRHLARIVEHLPALYPNGMGAAGAVSAAMRLLDAVLAAQRLRALETGTTPGGTTTTRSTAALHDSSTTLSPSRHSARQSTRGSSRPRATSASAGSGSASTAPSAAASAAATLAALLQRLVETRLLYNKACVLGLPPPLLADGNVDDRNTARAHAGRLRSASLRADELQRMALLTAADLAQWSALLGPHVPQIAPRTICVRAAYTSLLGHARRLCFAHLAGGTGHEIDSSLLQTAAFLRLLHHRWAPLLPADAELQWQDAFVPLTLRWLEQAQDAAEQALAQTLSVERFADPPPVGVAAARLVMRDARRHLHALLSFGQTLVQLFVTADDTQDQAEDQEERDGDKVSAASTGTAAPEPHAATTGLHEDGAAMTILPAVTTPSKGHTSAAASVAGPATSSPTVLALGQRDGMQPPLASPNISPCVSHHASAPPSPSREAPTRSLTLLGRRALPALGPLPRVLSGPHSALAPAPVPIRINEGGRQVVRHLHLVVHSLLRNLMLGILRHDMPPLHVHDRQPNPTVAGLDADFCRRIDPHNALASRGGAHDQSWVVIDHPTNSTALQDDDIVSGVTDDMDGGMHSWAQELPSGLLQDAESPLLRAPLPEEHSKTAHIEATAVAGAMASTSTSTPTSTPRSLNARWRPSSASAPASSMATPNSLPTRTRPLRTHSSLRGEMPSSESGVHTTSEEETPFAASFAAAGGVTLSRGYSDSACNLSDGSASQTSEPRRLLWRRGMTAGSSLPASTVTSRRTSPVLERLHSSASKTQEATIERAAASAHVSFQRLYGPSPVASQQYVINTLSLLSQTAVSRVACNRLNALCACYGLLPEIRETLRSRLTADTELDLGLPTNAVRCYLEAVVQYHAGILLGGTVGWVAQALPIMLSWRAQEGPAEMTTCLKPLTTFLEHHVADFRAWLDPPVYELMYDRLWRRVLDLLLYTAAVEPPAMFRVQRHAALIFYRALRLLIHFFNRLEPKLCPIAHIKAATSNTARVLQMLQQPTPALVAFYHRVCFQQLSDIANESSPELAERFAGLSSMSMPESSVEHLLQARQTSTEDEEAPLAYHSTAQSPMLSSRLPCILSPLQAAGVPRDGKPDKRSRLAVVCSLVLARIEREGSINLQPAQAHIHAEYTRTGVQLATECLRDLLLEDRKLRDHGLFMVDETCISSADLISWLVDHGDFDRLLPVSLPYGGGPERRVVIRQGKPCKVHDWGIILRGNQVRSVRKGSLADAAGVLEGDLIIHINGRDVSSCKPDDVAQQLRTPLPLTETLREDPSLDNLMLGDIVLLVESRASDVPAVHAPPPIVSRTNARELVMFLVREALLHPLDPALGLTVPDRSSALYRFSMDDVRHGVRPMGPPSPLEPGAHVPFDTFGPVTPAKGSGGSRRGGSGADDDYSGRGSDSTYLSHPTPPPSPSRVGSRSGGTSNNTSTSTAQGEYAAGGEQGSETPQWRARNSAALIQLRRAPNHAALLVTEVLRGLGMSDYAPSEAVQVKAQLQHVLGARQLDPRAMLFHTRLPDPPADDAVPLL